MSNRILSRRDVDFIVFEWLHAEELCTRPCFADHDRYAFEATIDVYETMAKELFAPHNKKNDTLEPKIEAGRVSVNPEVEVALRAFSQAGLVASGMPVEWGGMGLPGIIERAGMAFLSGANLGTAAYAVLTIANANLLLAHGSREQVQRYVLPMVQGRAFGTMCLSEPQAGSSLAYIRTRAQVDSDGRYRIFGSKMWISGGEHEMGENIVHLVLAKIVDEDGELPPGTKGISLFLVPRRLEVSDAPPSGMNDIALVGINHKMGYRGTVNCILNFGEGRFEPAGAAGAIGELVGKPGQGLACMFHMMNEARISVGLSGAALAYTGYLHALDYARTRRQGRLRGERNPQAAQVELVRHADVRRMLLAQKAYASGALALCLYAAKLSDDIRSLENAESRRKAELLLDLLTPVVKSWPAQWGLAANDLAIQVHGGYGYTREYDVEQFYRDNRLNAIHEGTFGIQALDLLGRKVSLEAGAGLEELTFRLGGTVRRAAESGRLAIHANSLQKQWSRVLGITEELNRVADVETRLANASPYLEAFGHVVVAWLWLDQAIVSEGVLERAGALDQDFYRGKLAACDYFFGWELPRVDSWLAVLSPIERTPLDSLDSWL